MTKQEHIDYWVKTAEDNWTDVQILFELKRYASAMFFAHLTIEKLAKALWVKNNNENYPPKLHNIVKILKGAQISLDDIQEAFLLQINDFQLEGRYPDYKEMLKKSLHEVNTTHYIQKINHMVYQI